MTRRKATHGTTASPAGAENEPVIPLDERYTSWLAIIDDLRKARRMTRKDLAAKARRDPSNISRYFSGQKNPSIATILLLSDAVDFDVEVALRLLRVLPPKRDYDPSAEALLSQIEGLVRAMPPAQQRLAVELIERLAISASEDKPRASAGQNERLPLGASPGGVA